MGGDVCDRFVNVGFDFWIEFPEREKTESVDISCHQCGCVKGERGGRRREGRGRRGTGGDEEKPANDVDADLEITTSVEKVDTDGGKTRESD